MEAQEIGTKTAIEKLVCSKEISEKLVFLGLHRAAIFHWYDSAEDDIIIERDGAGNPKEEKWSVGQLFDPGEEAYPAWTYEEIRIMLGHFENGADLPEPRPKPMPGETHTFYVYFPATRQAFASGAEANAAILLYLLENDKIKAKDCNIRYFKKFKPE